MSNPFIPIGFTQKSHGVAGEIKLVVEEIFIKDFLACKILFIATKNEPMPYFIKAVRDCQQYFIVKFDDFNTKEAVSVISSKPIFLRESDLTLDSEEMEEFDDEAGLAYEPYIGYEIHDQDWGLIGKIEDLVEYPQQEMACLTYEGREVMIPLIDDFIIEIDEDKQIILMDLPEGILDL